MNGGVALLRAFSFLGRTLGASLAVVLGGRTSGSLFSLKLPLRIFINLDSTIVSWASNNEAELV